MWGMLQSPVTAGQYGHPLQIYLIYKKKEKKFYNFYSKKYRYLYEEKRLLLHMCSIKYINKKQAKFISKQQ